MNFVNWGVSYPDLVGSPELSLFVTVRTTIPLNSAGGFNGVGLIAKWGNDIPAGETCFRLARMNRDSGKLSLMVGSGSFGASGIFEMVTVNDVFSQPDADVYRICARWHGARQATFNVNGVAYPTAIGPTGDGLVPPSLINSSKQRRMGQEEDFGVNQPVSGCYAEFAVYRAVVSQAVIDAYMAGTSLDGFATDGVLYCPHVDASDLTSHFGSHTGTVVVGSTFSCIVPP